MCLRMTLFIAFGQGGGLEAREERKHEEKESQGWMEVEQWEGSEERKMDIQQNQSELSRTNGRQTGTMETQLNQIESMESVFGPKPIKTHTIVISYFDKVSSRSDPVFCVHLTKL